MSQRAAMGRVQPDGTALAHIHVPQSAMEWSIYQFSLETTPHNQNAAPYCQAEIRHNGFFLCSTPQGTKDTATGPPATICKPNDEITIQWINAIPGDLATVSFFYDENPVGTSRINY